MTLRFPYRRRRRGPDLMVESWAPQRVTGEPVIWISLMDLVTSHGRKVRLMQPS
jgi:hypothetical protein